MTTNHLTIGLGGTGCAVVRELHKLLFVEWKTRNDKTPLEKQTTSAERPDVYEFNQPLGDTNWRTRVATLSIDSDQDDLLGSQDQWRVLGEQISLKDTEMYLMQRTGITQLLQNLRNFPGVSPWIQSDLELVDEINRGAVKTQGFNQIRRFGRLGLADRQNLNGIFGKISDRIQNLRAGGTNDIAIHICAGLGGGTGSGAVVDIVSQLRKTLENTSGDFPIYLYLFLNGEDVPADVGNFHANQYGALQELNALRRENYRPWDISNEVESSRMRVKEAFSSCFLISNVAEGGQVLTFDEQIYATSEFLFQKFARLVGNMPRTLADAHSFQNVTQYAEDTLENNSGRSTRFATFGIKRLGIPDQEIHQKIALTFSKHAILALCYANWDSQIGYAKAPRAGFDSDKFVREHLPGWKLTDVQVNLDAHPDYPSYADEWASAAGEIEAESKAEAGKDFRQWEELFRGTLEQFAEKGMRATGLGNFFRPKMEDSNLASRANELTAGVEKALLDGWLSEKEYYVTDNFPKIIKSLKSEMQRIQGGFAARVQEIPLELQQQEDVRARNSEKLNNVGWLSAGIFRSQDSLFRAYCVSSRLIHTLRTEELAATYAIRLLDKILPALDALLDRLQKVDVHLKKLADQWQNESDLLLKEKDSKSHEVSKELVQYVDLAEVDRTIRALALDKEIQDQQVRAMRRALDQARNIKQDFSFIASKLAINPTSMIVSGELRDQLERVAYREALDAHKLRESKNDSNFHPVLRLNIVKKLSDDNGGVVTEKLKAKLKEMMAAAMPALSFDGGAQPVEHPTPSPKHGCSIIIPECKALNGSNFRENLCNELRTMQGNRAREIVIFDVPEDRNSTEIVFVSTAYFFPLRMATPVLSLKSRFERKLERDNRRTRFLHFGETHVPGLPDLMKEGDADIKLKAIPYLILASESGLLHTLPEDERDDWQVVVGEKDPYGMINDKLGTGLVCSSADRSAAAKETPSAQGPFSLPVETVVILNSCMSFDPRSFDRLKAVVTAKVSEMPRANYDQLCSNLPTRKGMVFAFRGSREGDAQFKTFESGVTQALALTKALRS